MAGLSSMLTKYKKITVAKTVKYNGHNQRKLLIGKTKLSRSSLMQLLRKPRDIRTLLLYLQSVKYH